MEKEYHGNQGNVFPLSLNHHHHPKKKLKEKYSHRQQKEERKEEGCHLQEAFPEVVFNLCQPMEPPPQGFCALLSFPRRPEE